MPLRLTWDETSPGDNRQEVAVRELPGSPGFARVYLSPSKRAARKEEWFWMVFRDGRGVVAHGYAALKGDAMRLAEEAVLGPDRSRTSSAEP